MLVSFSSSLSTSTSVALDVSLPVICPSVVPRARHQRAPQTKKYLVLVNVIQGRTCITQTLGSGGLCVPVLSLSSCYNWNLVCPQQHTCVETLTKCCQAERCQSLRKQLMWSGCHTYRSDPSHEIS